MKKTSIKTSSIVEYQLPEFVRIEYPLLVEFLKEYYKYAETNFGPNDIISNINDYIKLDSLSNLADVFYLYNEPKKITKIEKNSTTIFEGINLVKITTLTPHNLIDGDTVDIILSPTAPPPGPSQQDIDLGVELDTFNGKSFTVNVFDEVTIFLDNSTSISEKNFIDETGQLFGTVVKNTLDDNTDEILIYSKNGNRKSLPLRYGFI